MANRTNGNRPLCVQALLDKDLSASERIILICLAWHQGGMAIKHDDRDHGVNLRDVALAALALDAAGGRDPVGWDDIVRKARELAADRVKTVRLHKVQEVQR
jgi:hypothetical protein